MTDPTTDPRGGGGGGAGLSKKIGPLPEWAWIVVFGVGGVVALLWIQHRRAAQQTAPTTDTTVTVPGVEATDVQGQLATIEAQIRDLQGAPSIPGPAGPAGPAGPTGPANTIQPPTPQLPSTENVAKGWNVDQWIRDLSTDGEAPGFTWEKLQSLNPGVEDKIKWVGPGRNVFKDNYTFRLR